MVDILESIMVKEKEVLNNYDIKHPGVIGSMYEGLTKELVEFLSTDIFEKLGLKVCSGFIYDNDGKLSGQIDCMLVKGEGEVIPKTDLYKYKIDDVMVVIEVKKTLDKSSMHDALLHLSQICNLTPESNFDFSLFKSSYRSIMNKNVPTKDQLDGPLNMDRIMYHFLMLEAVLPVKIIIGYNGYKTENGFRTSFLDILGEYVGKKNSGLSPLGLPSLIINSEYSILKMNGMPFSVPLHNGKWVLLASSHLSPIECLVELIWNRLVAYLDVEPAILGDDLDMPSAAPLLEAEFHVDPGGWAYSAIELSEEALKGSRKLAIEEVQEWSPPEISKAEYVLLSILAGRPDIKSDDAELIEVIRNHGVEPKDLYASLNSKKLIVVKNTKFEYLVDNLNLILLPSGESYAADATDLRFMNWFMNRKMNK